MHLYTAEFKSTYPYAVKYTYKRQHTQRCINLRYHDSFNQQYQISFCDKDVFVITGTFIVVALNWKKPTMLGGNVTAKFHMWMPLSKYCRHKVLQILLLNAYVSVFKFGVNPAVLSVIWHYRRYIFFSFDLLV